METICLVYGDFSDTHYTQKNQWSYNSVFIRSLNPMIKAQISGRMAFIGGSDVVTASVYSEKTRLKKLMMMMMMNYSYE